MVKIRKGGNVALEVAKTTFPPPRLSDDVYRGMTAFPGLILVER